MHKIIVIVYFCFIASFACAYEIVQSEDGDEYYYLVPVEAVSHERVRRQATQATSPAIDQNGYGISHTGTILNNDNHRLDGTASISKPWGRGPVTTGAGLEYLHKATGSGLGIDATNTKGYGTDLRTQGQYNFFKSRDGRTTADVTGEYRRHYGGIGGTGRPNYGAFVNFRHRF